VVRVAAAVHSGQVNRGYDQEPPRNTLPGPDAEERLRQRRVRLAAAGYVLKGGRWVPVRGSNELPPKARESVLCPGKWIVP
jgi:hypothetical protein